MDNPTIKKIPVPIELWSPFEDMVVRKFSQLEALFGLMATSEAKITNGGTGKRPFVHQVGELGGQLLDEAWKALVDAFEVQHAKDTTQA